MNIQRGSSFSILLVLILLLPTGAWGQSNELEYSVDEFFDWNKNLLVLAITGNIDYEGSNKAVAAFHTEKDMERSLPFILQEKVQNLQIDSTHTAAEYFLEDPIILQRIIDTTKSPDKRIPMIDQDLNSLSLEFVFTFFPTIADAFILHTRPNDLPHRMGWVPTSNFSGIVIHAKGPLPVHGTNNEEQLVPSLFPRIWSDDLELVLDRTMMEPMVLKSWGMTAYTSEYNEQDYVKRIGLTPLRVQARGIFGRDRTDIIIAEEDVRKILISEHNRKMLKAGRVLILCDLPASEGP